MAPIKKKRKESKPEKLPQRRPNLRGSTQAKWSAIQDVTGWESDADTADRLADFFMESRGIRFTPAPPNHP